MITDARIGSEPQLPQGDVPVFDMNGFSFKHIAKVLRNLSTLRLYMKFSQVSTRFTVNKLCRLITFVMLELSESFDDNEVCVSQ